MRGDEKLNEVLRVEQVLNQRTWTTIRQEHENAQCLSMWANSSGIV